MSDGAKEDIQSLSDSPFMERLAKQPHASAVGAAWGVSREEIIDKFLTALCDGDGPYTASVRAGVLYPVISAWAREDNVNSKIFAVQWDHAEQYAKEKNVAKARDVAFNGYDEYVTGKSGIAYERDPVTMNFKPVMQRRYHSDLMKFFLAADNPSTFGKHGVVDVQAYRDISPEEIVKDAPQIAPDEPGPAAPVL